MGAQPGAAPHDQRRARPRHPRGLAGRGLDLKPYALFTSVAEPGRGLPTDSDGNAGLDVFYNPTPSMRANFTVNTDFAQTEVDQRQVNLRFNLFFPERREFFLDGAGPRASGPARSSPTSTRKSGLSRAGTTAATSRV